MRKRTAKISLEVIYDADSFDDVVELAVILDSLQNKDIFNLPITNLQVEYENDPRKLN